MYISLPGMSAKPSAGGIRLLVRKPPLAPAAAAADGVKRLSLDGKKAPVPPAKGPSELYAELLEGAGGDAGAAAEKIKELLAAGSRDAAAIGGLALQEGLAALHQHGVSMCLMYASVFFFPQLTHRQYGRGWLPGRRKRPVHPLQFRRSVLIAIVVLEPLPCSSGPAAGLLEALQKAIGEDSLPVEREAGLTAYAALAREGGRQVEPFLLPMLPQVLACHADKVRGCAVSVRRLSCMQMGRGGG